MTDARTSLHVTLTLGNARVALGAAIPATVTIANVGTTALRVNRRLLASYQAIIERDIYFELVRDGSPYLGTDEYEQSSSAKPLDAGFYRTLAPGESMTRDLDLHELYHLRPGSYRIRAVYAPQASAAGKDAWSGTARSDEVVLEVRSES